MAIDTALFCLLDGPPHLCDPVSAAVGECCEQLHCVVPDVKVSLVVQQDQ